jgi:ArsR family transcriptional regulator
MNTMLTCLRALAEPNRLRLTRLCALDDLTVSDLTQILGGSQPGISRHLKVLVDGGVLERFREGSWVYYRLARQGALFSVIDSVLSNLPQDDAALRSDTEYLQQITKLRAEKAQAYFASVAADWDRLRAMQVDEALVDAAIKEMVLDRPVGSLLDVGTGTGHMLMLLCQDIGRGEGVDLSTEMLALARDNLQKAGLRHCLVRHGDMAHLRTDSADYDVVTFHQVLHYASRPVVAVREAARVLAPNGRVVIVDFLPHDMEDLREYHNHARLGFSSEDVEQWFAETGLTMVAKQELSGNPLSIGIWVGQANN